MISSCLQHASLVSLCDTELPPFTIFHIYEQLPSQLSLNHIDQTLALTKDQGL